MAEIGSGDYKARQAKKAAEAAKQAEAGLATQGLQLRCDVNGCVIVPINARQSTPGLTGVMLNQSVSALLHALCKSHFDATLRQPGSCLGSCFPCFYGPLPSISILPYCYPLRHTAVPSSVCFVTQKRKVVTVESHGLYKLVE